MVCSHEDVVIIPDGICPGRSLQLPYLAVPETKNENSNKLHYKSNWKEQGPSPNRNITATEDEGEDMSMQE